MSGGHFNGAEAHLGFIADEIEEAAKTRAEDLTPEVQASFAGAVRTLRRGEWMVRLIDLLLSGDIGPETFRRRWNEKLGLYSLPAHRNGKPCPDCSETYGCQNNCGPSLGVK